MGRSVITDPGGADLSGDRDGATFSHKFDYERLNRQMRRVYDVVADGQWRSLRMISELAEAPEASVSARLRDLRKPQFGAFVVERTRDPFLPGLWLYRLV